LLELVGIGVRRGGCAIIKNLSLYLSGGQTLCLTGPSGVGKTTVLEVAAGLLTPDQGRRYFEKGRLAYAFQDDALIPWRTVSQNLEFVLDARRDPAGVKLRVAKWLSKLGLENAADKYPAEMSGGMRRRLNLARAFCLEPELLILDEPFAFLDEVWLHRISIYLSELVSRGAAVLMASHQLEPLTELACHGVVIQKECG